MQDSAQSTRTLKPWMIAGMFAAAVVLWMLSGLFNSHAPPADDATSRPELDKPSVRVRTLAPSLIRNQLVVTGRTLADRRLIVKAETNGVIQALHVSEGDAVENGQALAELAVEDREARLAEARALVQQRELEYRAAQTLRDRDSVSEAELAGSKAALESARASLQTALQALERTRITTPIQGTVEDVPVEIGDFVDRGIPIVEVVDLDPLRVRGFLSERFLGDVTPESQAEVRLLEGTVLKGTVDFIGQVANTATRTFPVEVVVPNPESRWIEGMTAEITLFSDQVTAYRIPPSMLSLSDAGILGVKAVDRDDQVVFHPVSVVRDTPDGIWVSGLPDPVTLIAVGHEFVSDGQAVVPVPLQDETPGES